MDLLQTVKKEGSRGGRGEFKWEDVKTSQHRENFLGHSLMAPVGRWQKNKDLNWYAKTDANGKEQSEADARKEELRMVKEAEADAMAKALGYDVPDRNANMTALGGAKEVQKIIKESVEGGDMEELEGDGGRGVGFGGFGGGRKGVGVGNDGEVMVGTREGDERDVEGRRSRPDGGARVKRRRSRSRDRDVRRKRQVHKERSRDRRLQRSSRSRSRSRDRHHHKRRPRSKAGPGVHDGYEQPERHRDEPGHSTRHERRPERSRSPDERRRDDRRHRNRTDNY